MTTQTQTHRCIGSSRFGIEAHEVDDGDFPVQPSQKDGLGRMCKPHWREYTNALRKAAVARNAEAAEAPVPEPEPEVIEAPQEAPRGRGASTAPRATREAPRPSRRKRSRPRSDQLATRRAPGASPGPASVRSGQDATRGSAAPSAALWRPRRGPCVLPWRCPG